jgi:transcriptional regulator with XRE-family HTH domain
MNASGLRSSRPSRRQQQISRTPGLRREEVAQLVGVGVTWYTWFEQGRRIQVPAHFLERVAVALQLSPAERAHLLLDPGEGIERFQHEVFGALDFEHASFSAVPGLRLVVYAPLPGETTSRLQRLVR